MTAILGLNNCSPCAVALGFRLKWLSQQEVIDYCVAQLVAGSNDENIVLLAGGEDFDRQEMSGYLIALTGPNCDKVVAYDELRRFFLTRLQQADLSEQGKIDELQLLYSQFDYPEDMRGCSIYGQISIDPLVAMDNVIEELTQNRPKKTDRPNRYQ